MFLLYHQFRAVARLDKKCLCFGLFFSSLYSSFGGMSTSDYMFKRLKWSLLQAWYGKHPTHDDDNNAYEPDSPEGLKAGTDLCGGYFFVLWCITGDMEHLHSVYHLPNCNFLNPCAWCPANSEDVPWNDFRPGAECFARTFFCDPMATILERLYPYSIYSPWC